MGGQAMEAGEIGLVKIPIQRGCRINGTVSYTHVSRVRTAMVGARHSPRVSGAVLNLILGHPEVSGFAALESARGLLHDLL
eukprot:COSAG02_NODE_6278_length_3683_cov_3.575893_1_plen_80_part_10